MTATRVGVRVTYVSGQGETTLRMSDNMLGTMCKAARQLGARYFVARDGGVLGVFDMRTAQHNNPAPGDWSINDPVRTFPLNARDAAIVWAFTMLGRPR